MTSKEELLAAFDEALRHKWESMESALKDLTEDEANYRHEAYRDAERTPSGPPSGTILWQIHHLTHCYNHYTDYIKLRPQKVGEPPPPPILPMSAMLDQLRNSRSNLRATIAALSDIALEEKLSNGESVAEFVRSITRHDAWHSGQIAVARRLYRMRPI